MIRLLSYVFVLLFVVTGCNSELDIRKSGSLVLKTVDEDSDLPAAFVNGTHLHAETFGSPENDMVIFLHGGPGADYRNGSNVKQLADDGYFVILYDQRGSGLSQRHNKNTFSIDLMIQDLREVIAHHRTSSDQKVFLIGHSWGGMLAAAMINAYGTEIDGAVFAEPGGFTSDILFEYGEKTRTPALTSETLNDVVYLDQFIAGGENDHPILDYKLNVISSTVFEENNIEGIEGPSPFWRNGAVVLNALKDIAEKDGYDFTTNLHLFDHKVLFIYGERNQAYGLQGATQEASYFSDYDIVPIADTGHEMFYFKWEYVHPVVLEYLKSLK